MAKKTETAPAADMKMTPEDFAALRADVARVAVQDVVLGRVLSALVLHLGHAHGLDPAQEDAKAARKAREDARAAEDARLEDAAKAREEQRAAEDAQPRTPAETEALQVRRAAEDAQLKRDADARAKARAEEDAKDAGASPATHGAAPVEPEAPVAPVESEQPNAG